MAIDYDYQYDNGNDRERDTAGSFCSFWAGVGLGDLWVIALVIQIGVIFIYLIVYYVFFRDRKYVTIWHMFVVYFNTSFWWWLIWILIFHLHCGYSVGGYGPYG